MLTYSDIAICSTSGVTFRQLLSFLPTLIATYGTEKLCAGYSMIEFPPATTVTWVGTPAGTSSPFFLRHHGSASHLCPSAITAAVVVDRGPSDLRDGAIKSKSASLRPTSFNQWNKNKALLFIPCTNGKHELTRGLAQQIQVKYEQIKRTLKSCLKQKTRQSPSRIEVNAVAAAQ